METRVRSAIQDPSGIHRFGGLALGESTHLVDTVDLLPDQPSGNLVERTGLAFLLAERGRLSLSVWVDHVGSAGTRFVTGDLVTRPVFPEPRIEEMPQIHSGNPLP